MSEDLKDSDVPATKAAGVVTASAESEETSNTLPPEEQVGAVEELETKKTQRKSHMASVTHGPVVFEVEIPDDLHDSELEEEEFLQGGNNSDDVPIWFNVHRATRKTRPCCAMMCGLWQLSIILLVVLGMVVGVIEFDIGVPFYDRAEINQRREDSLLAIQRDADFVISYFNDDNLDNCVHAPPTIMTRNGTLVEGPAPSSNCQRTGTHNLRILYVSKDRKSNILTSENLEEIQKIEDFILNTLDLSKYCHLISSNYSAYTVRDRGAIVADLTSRLDATEFNYASCGRINSVVNFMDDYYFEQDTGLGYHLFPADIIPQQYDLSQDNIDSVVKFWGNYTTQSYDLTDYPAAVATAGAQVNIPNLFWQVSSSDFTMGSSEAVGLVSNYPLGLALNGYATSSEGVDDQLADSGTWLWETFDSYLKGASFEGVDVYFADTESEMASAETGALAMQSIGYFPFSVLFVLVYLMYMQDSFFLGIIGILQIILCFVPSLILYRYLFGVTYLGVLNLIAFYIILGIGVDDIFVFTDQWQHHRHERRFDQRLQKTFNVASKAMFTTSCTTFISFISNATSVFPAVASFGLFAALLVLVNFFAVTLYYPSVFSLYFKFIRHKWWDHPSRVICCNRTPFTDDILDEDEIAKAEDNKVAGPNSEGEEVAEESETKEEKEQTSEPKGSRAVAFFRDTWAPLIIKLRFLVLLVFLGIFIAAVVIASGLEPDESPPNTLPTDNNYYQYNDVLLDHFARAGNPLALKVHWVSGINPDDPIDRSGTSDTNTTDYGVAKHIDCDTFDLTPQAAQVWSLNTCHDMWFSNVTAYHGGSDDFGPEGSRGSKARRIVSDEVERNLYNYYSFVSCPHQGLRDWLLTDGGCKKLKALGLECNNETSAREGCIPWDTEGNSCEPFPVPSEHFGALFNDMMLDPNTDATTRQTNYDKFSEQIFISELSELDEESSAKVLKDDYSCRSFDGRVLLAMTTEATLQQDFAMNYEDGIALFDLWDEWSIQMRKYAPREMLSTMLTADGRIGGWSYFFLNETLIQETFFGIGLALILSFIVLSVVSGNPIMAFYSVLTIIFIVVDVFAFTVLAGYKLGVLEAVNYVVVIGLSIDYTVHLSEAYTESHAQDRRGRTILMMEEMGVSVLSGAVSTLGAAFFMFFAPNTFFVKFASFIFVTICLSCFYALTFFPALLSTVGPTGDVGNCHFWAGKRWNQLKHAFVAKYIETEEFKRREYARQVRLGSTVIATEEVKI